MSQPEAKDLFEKYQSGQCSAGERAIVENWLTFGEVTGLDLSEDELDADLMELRQRLQLVKVRKQRLWPMVASIAAAVATIVFGVWFFSPSRHLDNDRHPELVSGSDIAPGKSGATITLSTGEVIQLSDSKKGVMIDPTSLTYDDGSEIASEAAQPRNDGPGGSLKTGTITASTTKGQTYEFTLPDGTHIFLNADSKIIFPSQFSGKERKILLEGEAYFVVKHNEKQPFRVESIGANGKGQIVEDIGTEFNINAYADESSVKTTLVEGSALVRHTEALQRRPETLQRHPEFISGSRKSNSALQGRDPDLHQDDGKGVTLSPNQQASLTNGQLKVKTVDAAEAVLWKSGKFAFHSERIEDVMRQVARWYNVEVIYQGNVKDVKVNGTVSRFSQISTLLGILEETGLVKFKVEGKKVYVQ